MAWACEAMGHICLGIKKEGLGCIATGAYEAMGQPNSLIQ